ncbi:hypothetical protein D3C71_1466950 [compost metagenome]
MLTSLLITCALVTNTGAESPAWLKALPDSKKPVPTRSPLAVMTQPIDSQAVRSILIDAKDNVDSPEKFFSNLCSSSSESPSMERLVSRTSAGEMKKRRSVLAMWRAMMADKRSAQEPTPTSGLPFQISRICRS